MHMADALLSPAVGGTMWAVTAAAVAYSSRKVRDGRDDTQAPLMGVLGAFLFAAQMINFTIPVTGSSGHLGGGLLLTILLGPCAAFLTIASVLGVQALFFADGGLLALGCNVFNMGFIPAFLVYPLIHAPLAGSNPRQGRRTAAVLASAIACLQLGSFAVVLETMFSGISALPFAAFLFLMQPIHLAIGIVEGCVTAAVIACVFKTRPGIMEETREGRPKGGRPVRRLALGFLVVAIVTAGVLSWSASQKPDGLEWSISHIAGHGELQKPGQGDGKALATMQKTMTFLPDYSFKRRGAETASPVSASGEKGTTAWKKKGEASAAGIVGVIITLAVAFGIGAVLRKRTPHA